MIRFHFLLLCSMSPNKTEFICSTYLLTSLFTVVECVQMYECRDRSAPPHLENDAYDAIRQCNKLGLKIKCFRTFLFSYLLHAFYFSLFWAVCNGNITLNQTMNWDQTRTEAWNGIKGRIINVTTLNHRTDSLLSARLSVLCDSWGVASSFKVETFNLYNQFLLTFNSCYETHKKHPENIT